MNRKSKNQNLFNRFDEDLIKGKLKLFYKIPISTEVKIFHIKKRIYEVKDYKEFRCKKYYLVNRLETVIGCDDLEYLIKMI